MYKYTNKKQITPGVIHIVKNSSDFALLKEFNPEVIQVVYLNWSADETRLLALKYAQGSRIFLNRTEIVSPRFPRPYKDKASKEEMLYIKKQERIANNKTCQLFIKEVFKTIIKGFKIDPREDIDLVYETVAKPLDRAWLPKTYAEQQAFEGIAEALAELKTTVSEEEICKTLRDIAMYASDYDCNKHIVTRSIHTAVDATKDEWTIEEYTDELGIEHKFTHKKTYNIYNKSKYFISFPDEVFTWKDSYRTTNASKKQPEYVLDVKTYKNANGGSTTQAWYQKDYNNSNQTYISDITDVINASEKIQEARQIADWLAEHDMLDMYAMHCPVCGKPMNVYDGCNHCGYDLPKQAVSEYINGRITEAELLNMSPEEIFKTFKNEETDKRYAEWQAYNDFNMEGEDELYADFK